MLCRYADLAGSYILRWPRTRPTSISKCLFQDGATGSVNASYLDSATAVPKIPCILMGWKEGGITANSPGYLWYSLAALQWSCARLDSNPPSALQQPMDDNELCEPKQERFARTTSSRPLTHLCTYSHRFVYDLCWSYGRSSLLTENLWLSPVKAYLCILPSYRPRITPPAPYNPPE